MTTVRNMIKRGAVMVGRRMSIKRVEMDSTYGAWLDISDYVMKWGTYSQGFGDSFLGEYQISATTVTLMNGRRKFNPENESQSLFYKKLTRYGTKFKIEQFYIDDDDTEIAGLTWYGVCYAEPETSDDGTITFSVSPITKVLQDYPAKGITTGSQNTGAIVTQILQKSQGGIRLFDKFVEGTDDATRYSVNPSSLSLKTVDAVLVDDSDTCWDVIKRMSQYEDFFLYVNSSGNFVWDSKAAGGNVFNFNGAGSFTNEDAINIISIDKETSGYNNLWNRVNVTYTTGSVVSAATWIPGDGSSQSKYGERTYTLSALDFTSSSTATAIALALRTQYQTLRKNWSIKTVLIPQLNVKDTATLSYIGEIIVEHPFTIGVSLLGGSDVLGGRSGSISIQSTTVIIRNIEHDLDDLTSSFELQEVI